MASTEIVEASRFPRPIKRFPRNPLNDNAFFEQTLIDIYPKLLNQARKIHRPNHIDIEDLIQNAYLKIIKYKHKYDVKRNAAIVTWLMNIANREFYTTVTTEFCQKRFPGYNNLVHMEDESEHKFININECNCPSSVEHNMIVNDILKRTITRLHDELEIKILEIILSPPQDLVSKIIEQNKIKSQKHANDTKEFKITKNDLSEYLNIPTHKIVKARKNINTAILKAIND